MQSEHIDEEVPTQLFLPSPQTGPVSGGNIPTAEIVLPRSYSSKQHVRVLLY